jgi:hypothetical protein
MQETSALAVADVGNAALGMRRSMQLDSKKRTFLGLRRETSEDKAFNDDVNARYVASTEVKEFSI